VGQGRRPSLLAGPEGAGRVAGRVRSRQGGSSFKSSSRERTLEQTGQKQFPWIEFEDGSFYRDESKEMAATIRDGRLDEKRQTA
jgi:hypothetical protein